MTRLEYELDTTLPPERVRAAITDFTDRRPERWPGLKPEQYRVHAVGADWADIREGSGGILWVDEHYDWSEPGVVTWVARESGFLLPGGFVRAELHPRADGGTTIRLTWDRVGRNPVIRVLLGLTAALGLMPIRGSWESALRRMESAGGG